MSTDWRVLRAARLLVHGGVIAHATEGVVGLAASAGDRAAGDLIRALKRRPRAKAFIVVAARIEQLLPFVSLNVPRCGEVLASWPGPYTWILPATQSAPRWLKSGTGHIAVRITAHPQMAALCAAAGPLVSTSANPAGRAPARTLLAARRYFGKGVDLYLGGSIGPSPRPTVIRNGTSGQVVRA